MFDLDQKVSLESFQPCQVVLFRQKVGGVFSDTAKVFSQKQDYLKKLKSLQRANKKFSANHGYNISELCNILEKFGFTTSKAVVDIQYKKHCIRLYKLTSKLPNDLRHWKLEISRKYQKWVEIEPSGQSSFQK